jgi:hypothetical protein
MDPESTPETFLVGIAGGENQSWMSGAKTAGKVGFPTQIFSNPPQIFSVRKTWEKVGKIPEKVGIPPNDGLVG